MHLACKRCNVPTAGGTTGARRCCVLASDARTRPQVTSQRQCLRPMQGFPAFLRQTQGTSAKTGGRLTSAAAGGAHWRPPLAPPGARPWRPLAPPRVPHRGLRSMDGEEEGPVGRSNHWRHHRRVRPADLPDHPTCERAGGQGHSIASRRGLRRRDAHGRDAERPCSASIRPMLYR